MGWQSFKDKNKNKQPWLLIRAIRPRQWVKNLAVFAAIIFNGLFFNQRFFLLSLKSFGVLCLLSSAAYLINDLVDWESDRLHPYKKLRPIASGKLSKEVAILVATLLVLTALVLAFWTSRSLLIMALLFLVLQLSYTLVFKRMPVIDAMVIAGAYILRVYTGEVVTGYHLSVWLMLAVVFLALFLAMAKRRAELALLTEGGKETIGKTRISLVRYKEPLLDIYLSLFATGTWITYGFYTFSEFPHYSRGGFLARMLRVGPEFWEKKWLMLSVPFVLYGIMRYLQLIYEFGHGESPERLLFMDRNLFWTVVGWGLVVVGVIYLI